MFRDSCKVSLLRLNHHHHHWCSALRQVLGTQLLHSSLFSALLFIFSKEPSFSSSSIPILGLPLGLLPTILPSITSLNSPSPRKTCPIKFFFRCTIVSTNFRLSPTLSSTFSFVVLSSQLPFSNLLHSHISKASKRLISSFLKVHVSAPYKATLQTIVFIILFLRFIFIFCARSSFLLPNESLAIPI